MRRLTALLWPLLAVTIAARADSAPRPAPRVIWIEGVAWPEVVQDARAQRRHILIDFYATWCGPCKLLEAMVFNERAVVDTLADVVTFKVDIDQARGAELQERFGVSRLPTLVWCDPAGQEQDRFTGYVSSREFLDILGLWRRGRTIESALLDSLAADPQNPQALLAMHLRCRDGQRTAEAAAFLGRLTTVGDQARRSAAVAGLVTVAGREMEAGRLQEAKRLALAAAELIPGKADDLPRQQRAADLRSLTLVADFQLELGDTLGTLATYERMIDLDRGHLPALTGFVTLALAADVRLGDATTCALRAAIRTDKRPDLVAQLAECYHRRSFHDRAVQWIGEAIERDPAEPKFREQLQRYQARRLRRLDD